MMYSEILNKANAYHVRLVVVSKTRSIPEITGVYDRGQRIFGENRVQELVEKQEALPKDIEWHLIGHLQKNKVKYIAPFISMIHSVDSYDLLQTIDKEANKHNRYIDVLLQFHIATEETKFGLTLDEACQIIEQLKIQPLPGVRIRGVMGMASFTSDRQQVRNEFQHLKRIFDQLKEQYFKDEVSFSEISMGMSGDFDIALEEGSTLIRVGSAVFN
jgi:pyridoxal phosphate enzyme (YggS family)